MYPDAGDARYTIAASSSSSFPMRPIGTLARSFCPSSLFSSKAHIVCSDRKKPGARATTRTPRGAHSTANSRVSPSNSGLTCNVRGLRHKARRRARVHRSDVDDGSAAGLEHVFAYTLRTEKHSGQIRVDHILPLLRCHIFGRRYGGDSGIVDQDIKPAKLIERVLYCPVDVLFVANIRPDRNNFGAIPFESRSRCPSMPRIPGNQCQVASCLRQPASEAYSQPARGAGDDRGLSRQVKHRKKAVMHMPPQLVSRRRFPARH